MTVSELIARRHAFDGRLRVVTPGFDESDLEDVDTVQAIRVAFDDARAKFHGGRHKKSPAGVPAVKIDWQ
ncbi:MAG: hypothetical protein JXR37_32470 [Kiritimatiellae bacterium]|nr:hypothetical protein [Kiritimatiellia bacterium]